MSSQSSQQKEEDRQVTPEQKEALSPGTDDQMVVDNTNLEATKSLSKTNEEIVRLIGQHLRELGFDQTADKLSAESGCKEPPPAAALIAHITNGNWEKAYSALDDLKDLTALPDDIVKMRFLVLEQKYLECLEDEKHVEGLNCLRNEITPLNYNAKRVHELATFLTFSSADLKEVSGWAGKGCASRRKLLEKLQAFVPENVMLPPMRLLTLLKQAHNFQEDCCTFHNTYKDDDPSSLQLLSDHTCGPDQLPRKTTQEIFDHQKQVWHCKFSRDGRKLATGDEDGKVMIYDINQKLFEATLHAALQNDPSGAAFLSWSPDGHYLVVCGPENSKALFIWDSITTNLTGKVDIAAGRSLTCACWGRDCSVFYAGGTQGQFYVCDIYGKQIKKMEGVRVQALHPSNWDDNIILVADTHYRIEEFDMKKSRSEKLLKEDYPIMSFSVSANGKLALLNVASQGLHLWDLEDKVLLRRFQGVFQDYYTIYSCFGGVNQAFIASGSEEPVVHIFNIRESEPILLLKGHKDIVNCVDWNPTLPSMLASASDDGTVRLWGPSSTVKQGEDSLFLGDTSQPQDPPPQDSLSVSDHDFCEVAISELNMPGHAEEENQASSSDTCCPASEGYTCNVG